MEVRVETASGLARRIHVTIPGDRLEKAFGQRLRQIASRARVAGFRPGKAPMKVIEKQYGADARGEAVSDLVNETWPQALAEARLQPAGRPDFEITSGLAGEAFSYVASFEVYPEIALADLSQISVSRPQVEVTEADVARLVDNLRKARRTLHAVERPAQLGDSVTMDFEGKIDGVPFNGGKGEDQTVELGEGRFLPDLENGLVGHAKGETFEVPVSFPADYRNTELAGKNTQFTVTIKEIREPKLPELDAEFLKIHGIEEGGVEALNAKCRTALETERDKAVKQRVKLAVMDQLVSLHPIDVPSPQVASEIERLRMETANRIGMPPNNKIKPEQLQQMLPDVMFEAAAKRRVTLGLVVADLVNKNGIQHQQERVERLLGELAADYEQPEEVFNLYRSRADLMEGLRMVALEEQVVEFVLASAKIVDEASTLEDLLKAQNQSQAQ